MALRDASALGHTGLMLGLLGLILTILALYAAAYPSGSGGSLAFFSLMVWGLGLLFVVGEWFESNRTV